MSINYKSHFTTIILNRAIQYSNRKIHHYWIEDDAHHAEVQGSELYHVMIRLEGDEVAQMGCTCPYAASGLACKHMAGLLMYMDKRQEEHMEEAMLIPSDVVGQYSQPNTQNILTKRENYYYLSRDYVGDAVLDDELISQGSVITISGGITKLLRVDNTVYGFVKSGNASYMTTLEFDEIGDIEYASCSCKNGAEYGMCRHISAVLQGMVFDVAEHDEEAYILDKLITFDETSEKRYLSSGYSQVKSDLPYYFDSFTNTKNTSSRKETLYMRFFVEANVTHYGNQKCSGFSVLMEIGQSKLYRLRNIEELLDAKKYGTPVKYGKAFSYNPAIHKFSPGVESFLEFLAMINDMGPSRGFRHYNTEKVLDGKFLNLRQESLRKQFLGLLPEIMKEEAVFFDYKVQSRTYSERLSRIHSGFTFPAHLRQDDGFHALHLDMTMPYLTLTDDFEYIAMDGQIYHLDTAIQDVTHKLDKLFKGPRGDIKEYLPIPEANTTHFLEHVYPQIEQALELKLPEQWEKMVIKEPLEIAAYVEPYNELAIQVKVEFSYGAYTFNGLKNTTYEDAVIIRSSDEEQSYLAYFNDYRIDNHYYIIEADDDIFYFIEETVPLLQKLGSVYYDEHMKVKKSQFSQSAHHIGMTMDDYMQVSFGGDYSPRDLQSIYEGIRYRRKYIRLKDGSFIEIDNQEAEDFKQFVDYLDIEPDEIGEEIIIKPNRAMYLNNVLENETHLRVNKSEAFDTFVGNVKAINDKTFRVPVDLDGVLRDYQLAGFNWFKGLAAYHLGGIMADDMGLGKTLQTIAFIASEYQQSKEASLIVVPTSLVYNWEDEVMKFLPWLPIQVISGSKKAREILFEESFDDYAMVITSYPLLIKDIEIYKEHAFKFCILDEAQKIKNPMAKTSKMVKTIKARSKFALTGTPVENNLMELWSLFDFIMPGYMANQKTFSQTFDKLIAENDTYTIKRLKYMIQPFMIRRIKEEVLTELPDKIITKSLASLTTDQEKMYLAYLQRFRESMQSDIEEQGFNKSRIKILAYLTRLRQICCHPAMFVDDYKGSSGKLDLLKELLSDGVEAGHKILIFSQFTSMLDLIGELLDKEGYSYLYLSGATKPSARKEMVNHFQEGETDVFLISLKAGGTGLNLTKADVVIHMDPWWNPAVEDQATDRAYRIGQKNNVQVFKLITKGSIEEKIYELQERKRELINKVIEPGEQPITSLSQSDIQSLFQ